MNKLADILAGVLGVGGALVVFIIWLALFALSVLTTVAIGAIAGDVLGLWEVVDFV